MNNCQLVLPEQELTTTQHTEAEKGERRHKRINHTLQQLLITNRLLQQASLMMSYLHYFVAKHLHFEDRKSTRLNSSHVAISYTIFCLKKKITKKHYY